MPKNILKHLISGVIITMIFVVPFFVQAQGGTLGGSQGGTIGGSSGSQSSGPIIIVNPFNCSGNGCTISGLIKAIVNNILIPIGAVVAVMMIMYAGFLYVTAGGDPGKIKTAHQALTWAVIGAAILLGAWVISEAIQGTINQLKTP